MAAWRHHLGLFAALLLSGILAVACAPAPAAVAPTAAPVAIALTLVADGQSRALTTTARTVGQALAEANVALAPADEVDPPTTTPLPAAAEQACAREVLEETAHDFVPTALVGVYLNRFVKTRTGDDLTYLRFAFAGTLGTHHSWRTLGTHHSWRTLDTGILRTVWMTPDEIRACPERHRSPLLLACLEDYLAGQRHPLTLVHTDPSVMQSQTNQRPVATGQAHGAAHQPAPAPAHLINQR